MIPLPPWAYAAAAAATVAVSFGAGWTVRSWKCDAAAAKAMEKAAKKMEKAAARMSGASAQFELEREEARYAETDRQTAIRTIFRERTVPADCAVPDAARRVLEVGIDRANAVSRGEPPPVMPDITTAP